MESIAFEYFSSSIDPGNKLKKYKFHLCLSDDNEHDACDWHAHMFHLLIY